MKYILALLSLMFASTAFADGSVVRWNNIVGVITAQNVDNPVADIDSGTFAWTTTRGQAAVDLRNGAAFFVVRGLVINGTMFSGTPGPITKVIGTLVCNPGQTDNNGTSTEKVFDTAPVSLSDHGNAAFSGTVGPVTSPCTNPVFLIRIAEDFAFGRWIATGAVRSFTDRLFFGDY